MTKQAKADNLASDNEAVIPLPACLIRQPDGIFVDLSLFPVGGGFDRYIDSLFSSGARFCGLDYRLLMGLLYDYDSIMETHGITAKVKLAEDIVAFPSDRRALYKGVKIDGAKQRAEYFFQPISVEVVIEEPVYGAPGEDGVAPIIGSTRKEVIQPIKLDLDEFIADMWLKGVRYGIAVEAVASAISRGAATRINVAVQRDATEGSDAEIEEACSVLHRDNAPKLLVNGKADLRKFQNRFPQIASGARLLKKKARVLGTPGIRVNGERIKPLLPEDNIDLFAMAGPGTHVETQDGEEFILASQDGFLSLDTASNIVSVTEMIENKGGISLKTTGDLSLAGNDFVEHGEVQEGRVVEGKNMTFHSDVYGDVVSNGGFILLEANLSGGSAKSYGGDVTSNGRVFNSIIEACTGKVSLQYAESCLILGESVVIDRAVNCEIVADNIQVNSAEGCGIAGKNVQIKSSNSCRSKETIVSMLVPDLSASDAKNAQLSSAIDDCNKIIKAKDQEVAQLKSDPEFAKYLALAAKIRQGTIQLNAAQQDAWKKMSARFAGSMSAGSKLTAEKQEQLTLVQALIQEQAQLQEARKNTSAGIHCEITEVVGDTSVRSMAVPNGIAAFQKNKPSEIRIKLREQDVRHKRIFSDSTGGLVWNYEAVVAAP
ncbi:MAG: flagellar assembly protein A [Gallionella sp.]